MRRQLEVDDAVLAAGRARARRLLLIVAGHRRLDDHRDAACRRAAAGRRSGRRGTRTCAQIAVGDALAVGAVDRAVAVVVDAVVADLADRLLDAGQRQVDDALAARLERLDDDVVRARAAARGSSSRSRTAAPRDRRRRARSRCRRRAAAPAAPARARASRCPCSRCPRLIGCVSVHAQHALLAGAAAARRRVERAAAARVDRDRRAAFPTRTTPRSWSGDARGRRAAGDAEAVGIVAVGQAVAVVVDACCRRSRRRGR